MPKVPGLSADTRKAMLSEELGDGDGEVEIVDPPPTPPPPVPPPPPPPAADLATIVSALVAGITQGNASSAAAIKEALGTAASLARDPIAEDKNPPRHSIYSHPAGDRDQPRTVLRCPMFLGVYDDEGHVIPALEIFEDTCTEWERVELNRLRPGTYPRIERNDGVTATWRVVQKSDDTGAPIRLVIAVPVAWLARDQFQMMPSQKSFLSQLNAALVPA